MGTKPIPRLVIALSAIIFLTQRPLLAADIFVDDSHTSGTFDGMGWGTSFRHLQDAIDVASSGDTIHVAQGTYYPDLDGGFNAPAHVLGSRTESLALKPGVIMLGGYIGYNDASPNTRDPDLYPTILSGDIGTTSVATDNSYHVVTVNNATAFPVTRLDGFTIRDGYANGGTTDHRVGAGITITGIDSSPRILNCIIENNTALSASVGQGGGLASRSTNNTVVLTNCLFQNNSAELSGGAIYSANPELLDIQECTFIANSTTSTAAQPDQYKRGGGAIHCFGSDPETQQLIIRDSSFTLNQTNSGNGGAVYALLIPFEARRCVFTANTATQSTGSAIGRGGGVYLTRAYESNFFECDFIGNHADPSGGSQFAGGGIAILEPPFVPGFPMPNIGPIALVNCRFLGNTTEEGGLGGGMVHDHVGTMENPTGVDVINCLFAGNMAGIGAAAYCSTDSNFRITKFYNCTIADNDAGPDGLYGGIAGKTSTAVEIRNCILWGNKDQSSYEDPPVTTNLQQIGPIDMSGPDIQYSDVAGALYTGAGNINDDPLFVDTSPVDVTLRNYSLQPCSPASDAADYDAVIAASDPADLDGDSNLSEPLPRDLILAARVTDNDFRNDDGIGTFTYTDMGAYEIVVPECPLIGDVNGDSDVDGLDVGPFTVCVLAQSSTCPCGDLDFTGITDFNDIDCFVDLLLTGTSCGIVNCESGQRSFPDCNANGVNDKNDIGTGGSPDCNENGVPDECEIDENSTAEGGPWYCESDCADDVNDNGIPDECEDDCNTNGIPDSWDISETTSDDVNTNGVPDECEWDCNTNGIPDAWDISETTSADCNTNGIPDECEDDCNTNGVPDDCDVDITDPDGDEWVSPDCNEDGYPDECNLSLPPPFGSSDCNTNGIPDECDIADCESDPACDDCNSNGIPDGCDIEAEISEDTDTNGIPDECEEESLMGGGGESMMSSMGGEGDTGETPMPPDEEAAWEAFYEWSIAQCWGLDCESGTDAQFAAMIAKLSELGLPTAAVGP